MAISSLIKKEFIRLRSDKRSLILLFTIPMILIVIFGLTTGVGPTKFFVAAIISRDEMPTCDDFPSNSSEYDDIFISIVEQNSTTWDLYNQFNSTNIGEYN